VSILLRNLLCKIPEDTEKRVDNTYKRIYSEVREIIRSETGLLLNRQEFKKDPKNRKKNISVPIKLLPGFPEDLQKKQFDQIDELVLLISPYRRKIEQIKDGLCSIKPLVSELFNDGYGERLGIGQADKFTNVSEFIEKLLKIIDQKDPVKQILSVNRDILGIYSYRVYRYNRPQLELFYQDPFTGHIEIYWALIGLIAGMLGIDIEALTAVVIIHEVAHAYTHLGADIDGKRWDSRWFAQSEHELKEGIAQYYTHYITERIDIKIPGTHEAYQVLMERQPKAYTVHKEWVAQFHSEEIRHALIAIRRREPVNLNQFVEFINEAKLRLRGNE
jgi:hypothetical protein